MENTVWNEPFTNVMDYVRSSFPDEVDEAYDHYWEEDDPEDFLSGMPLELGFLNFEDWLVCDYAPKDGKCMIDRYIDEKKPSQDEIKVLEALKDSFVSIYEVASNKDGVTKFRDIVRDGSPEYDIKDERFSSLPVGECFGGRLLNVDGTWHMGRSLYPFGKARKGQALDYFGMMTKRFLKFNKDATVDDFLRQESYAVNIVWLSCLNMKA